MLTIHRAERVGRGDPFKPDVVAVPTRGMERWLTQRLSLRCGVCGNVLCPSPRTVVVEAVARASNVEPREDPSASLDGDALRAEYAALPATRAERLRAVWSIKPRRGLGPAPRTRGIHRRGWTVT